MKLSAVAAAMLVWCCSPAMAQQDGAALYATHCAQCHDASEAQSRVPARSAIQAMSFEHVLAALTSGSMAAMAKERSDEERRTIAAFVTGKAATSGAAADAQDVARSKSAAFRYRSMVRAGTDGASISTTAAFSRSTWQGSRRTRCRACG